VGRALLRVLIEKIFSWAGRKFSLGREQFFYRQGGVNADLLVSIKFKKVQTEGGSKGVSRLIVALSHKDYPCVSI
jgi:hypothetical protein